MGKQATIKEIAQMAGVSPGTVDRILHNRGNVAEDKRRRIEEIIEKVGYKINIHTSAVAYRKECRIALAIPENVPGEYWDDIHEGILRGISEYSDIDTNCMWLFFDQFDRESCREQFEKIPSLSPDAVILGPAFENETRDLCRKLSAKSIPYVFLDKNLQDASPVASFSADQPAGGALMARLITNFTPEGSKIAIMKAIRSGEDSSKNSDMRKDGFVSFFREKGEEHRLIYSEFSVSDTDMSRDSILNMLEEHPDIKGIAVLNSRGHIIADILSSKGISDIHVLSFDLTAENARCLRDGSIEALLCQRPHSQGYNAVSAIIHFLLFKKTEKEINHFMPIDIVMSENLPYYKL